MHENQDENLDDEMPVLCKLSLNVTQCDCCGKDNLKRTVELSIPDGGVLYLGVICAGRWFDLNMTGNPWYAADRLAKKLRTMDNREVENIVDEIKEANEERDHA